MSTLSTFVEGSGRLFVVGDIHGCLSELETLLHEIVDARKLNQNDRVVFLGDYVDRGPDSKGVVKTLIDFKARFPASGFLRGNHEEMLLSYLGVGGAMGELYFANGGSDTLRSYGVSEDSSTEQIKLAISEEHLKFFENLERGLVTESKVFVHAGLDPLRSLHSQTDDDLMWIRDEFIFNIHFFEKTVIFGHTPFEDVLFHLPYKIGIDTGLVFGNKLTCLELVGKEILQVKKGERSVKTKKFPEA